MIDINRKYQTRDGRAVRILCVDGANDLYPIVGFIDGQVWTFTWKANGTMSERADCRVGNTDLIPVPTKHEGWMVFDTSSYALYTTKESAQKALQQDIGCQVSDVVAHVTWED